MKTKKKTRVLAIVLLLVMVLGMIPVLSTTANALDDTAALSIRCKYLDSSGKEISQGFVTGNSVLAAIYYQGTKTNILKDASTWYVDLYLNFTSGVTGLRPDEDIYFIYSYRALNGEGKNHMPVIDDKRKYDANGAPIKDKKNDEWVEKCTGPLNTTSGATSRIATEKYCYDGDGVLYVKAVSVVKDESGNWKAHKEAGLSISITLHAKAVAGVPHYKTVGLQVRKVDNIPLGPYVYTEKNIKSGNGVKVPNNRKEGLYTEEERDIWPIGDGGHKYVSKIDGVTYDSCYFDIPFENDGFALTLSAETKENLNNWVTKTYIPTLKSKNVVMGAEFAYPTIPDKTVEFFGPRYIELSGGGLTTRYTNLAYYTRNNLYNEPGTAATNSWLGYAFSADDWERMRYDSLVFPFTASGSISIYIHDIDKVMKSANGIDDPATLIVEPYCVDIVPKFSPLETNEQFYGYITTGLAHTTPNEQTPFSEFYYALGFNEAVAENNGETLKEWYEGFKALINEMVSVYENKGNGTIETNKEWLNSEEAKLIRTIMGAHETAAINLKTRKATNPDDVVASAVDVITIEMGSIINSITNSKAEGIEGYVFSYGYLEDTVLFATPESETVGIQNGGENKVKLMSKDAHVLPIILNADGSAPKDVSVVLSQISPDIDVHLMFKKYAGTTYTTKVRINGEVKETYTSEYSGKAGDIINKDDIDTSKVPDGYEVEKIVPCRDSFPFVLDEDSDKNIIYIDCENNKDATYTVQFFLDGVLKATDTYTAKIGDVISTAPGPKNPSLFDRCSFDHETGVPLTIVDDNGLIRVYYVKDYTPTSVSNNAFLYDKNPLTGSPSPVTEYKSGYGFWTLFYVDGVPDWLVTVIKNNAAYQAGGQNRTYGTSRISYLVWGGCSAINCTSYHDKYRNICWTATATWQDGFKAKNTLTGTDQPNGVTKTVNLELVPSKCGTTRLCYQFPAHNFSANGEKKAYIPVAWKDGTQWKVNYTFNATWQYIVQNSVYQVLTACSGHECSDEDGNTWTEYCYYYITPSDGEGVSYHYNNDSKSATGSASIFVKGNMHEDDFTGDRR